MSYDPMNAEGRRGPIFVHALLGALARPRIWLLTWFVLFVLAAVAAVPWVGRLAGIVSERYAPGDVIGGLNAVFRHDHSQVLGDLRGGTAETVALLGLIAMLFGAFAAGGWLQIFLERTPGPALRRFLWGGSRYFWRFFRVWILTLIALGAVSWIVLGWPWKVLVAGLIFGAPGGETEVLTSEWAAAWLGWLQAGTHALLFALVLTWADLTRTRLALQDASSGFLAGLATVGLIVRYPVRVLRPMVLLFAIEVAVLWGAGGLVGALDGGLGADTSWHALALIFLVGQLAVIWRQVTRGARYHAAVSVSRDLVPPEAPSDPWARRVGGPGGPQYPIDSSDDYNVSL